MGAPEFETDLHFDAVVIGNGAASLWLAHGLWKSKRSICWITTEEPCPAERSALARGWHWGASAELQSQLKLFNSGDVGALDCYYFDAKSSKRLRRFGEKKVEWGEDEQKYFAAMTDLSTGAGVLDVWDWQKSIQQFHSVDLGGKSFVDVFREPRFARASGEQLNRIITKSGRVSSVIVDGKQIVGKRFYFGDFRSGAVDSLADLMPETADAEVFKNALKGRSFHAGFGLQLWHSLSNTLDFAKPEWPTGLMVMPLVVNPGDKGKVSHVWGRFFLSSSLSRGTELCSVWIGLLSDEELEDNNEILKKIKLAKRAAERGLQDVFPQFRSSIQRESVTFEPQMLAIDLVKKRKQEVLGATLVSDWNGVERTLRDVAGVCFGVKELQNESV